LAGFICVAKLKSCHLISAQHGLVEVCYTAKKDYQFQLLLIRNQVEEPSKAVAKVLD